MPVAPHGSGNFGARLLRSIATGGAIPKRREEWDADEHGFDGFSRMNHVDAGRSFAFYSFSISFRLVLNRQGRQERQGKANTGGTADERG
jgi:hypothetical protein